MTSPIAVLDAGSWGTALAIHLDTIQAARCNTTFLPNIKLPDNIELHRDLTAALNKTITSSIIA